MVSFRNNSDEDALLYGACAPKADVESFRIEVGDAGGKVAPETNLFRWLRGEPVPEPIEPTAGTSGPRCGAVPPKQTSSTGFVLSQFYNLSKPGKYKIRVQWTEPKSKVVIRSNTITITVAG